MGPMTLDFHLRIVLSLTVKFVLRDYNDFINLDNVIVILPGIKRRSRVAIYDANKFKD
jgi:hypothetical protein